MASKFNANGSPSNIISIPISLIIEKKGGAGEGHSYQECSTPKSEEAKLKTPLVCPPAPRKPRPSKRKLILQQQGFYPVPADLASVFLPLLFLPNKRIRALPGATL
ncbi:hypothetical protein J5N97_030066 [Dioscorea zingiberensis]|uniref:Uncharacterized protein n=1 Tax=Dioscorea zingiberensis TaxID=325984 RepID=A0A9D5H3S5_9LILI|nr:hypothetical protein J5N97_030066 [Dioscorea zingiberensis]